MDRLLQIYGDDSISPYLSARDQLLLAFANLASYGIYARPAVGGSLSEAQKGVSAEAAQRSPFAPDDYVFWRRDDEPFAFGESGALIGPLPLHFGNPSLAAAIEQASLDAGIPTFDARGSADGGVRSIREASVLTRV